MALPTVKAQEETDLSAIHFSTDVWADTITYNGASIAAIVVEYTKDDNRRDAAQIEVRKSDVAAPAYRDTVVIDGTTWTVKHWTAGNRLTWVVALEKSVRPGFER